MSSNKIIPVREQIADQIRSDVISGALAPNTKLNEQSLADRFGVSRGPVRDVLLQLTKEGLLVSKNNCGVSVNSTLSSELQELMIEIRLKIESYAVKTIINTFDDSDHNALESILAQLKPAFEAQDFTTVTKADIDFHHYIVKKAGGDALSNLWFPIVMRMRMNYKRVGGADQCVDEHKAILDAIKQKDTNKTIEALEANVK